MHHLTDKEIFFMIEHLAWRARCCFVDDFKKAVREWYKTNTSENDIFIDMTANSLWNSMSSRGIVETFQNYITDKECCRAFVYALNK